ncbi:AraC family transcriptional regulator [Pseudoteredinibacter isoporae]|uniref:AraC-like DNA-binding protein n=1 Tax=Pseudoteredinibacter isoporae TaxID=570281 RepID=A0A7X0MWY3_9GAMM|nr:AraC family transcriptional regulator [Pseudoteredinibacter isoporae]MBB6521479.1 AraC-like DNA-binding protein [Pseudoteredinibacter isoporae]NHO87033.1 AraC family transcriptional regulator [Pseudoteredinibacter isoporae]NIB24514.1 AraC family transcriptional regulator [Pseudoteredinibacter isoporae]
MLIAKRPLNSEFSIIGTWLALFAESLKSYNCDTVSLFEEYDISPTQAFDPDNRIDARLLSKLWEAGVQLSGDEAFGLRTGARAHPGTFQALGLMLCCSSSLKEHLQDWIQYSIAFSTAGYSRLQEGPDRYYYKTRLHRDKQGNASSNAIALDATVAAVVQLCRTHYDRRFTPLKIKLPIRKPADRQPYTEYYNCPVEFDCDGYEIQISKSDMESPIPHGNSVLRQQLEHAVVDYISEQGQADVIIELRTLIQERLSQGPIRQEELAKALHLSVRSLQRHLRARGTCFSELIDDVRREQAMLHIRHSKSSIVELGELLGFSTAGNFSRSFKRWTGTSPLQYRKHRL